MAALALSIFGWQSLRQLETSLLPELEYPEFVIITEFSGGSAEEIENAITIHLEEAISSLPALQDVVSSSRDGLSIVTAKFHWDIDHRFTILRIREKIDAVYNRLPKGTVRPYIMDFNPGSLPVMELMLTGEVELTSLGEFARDVLNPRFAQIEGIAAATVAGKPREAVQIAMDPIACARLGINADQITQSVQENLPSQPISSTVLHRYAEYPLTVEFPLSSPQDLAHIPIQNPGNIPITLKDVAQIIAGPLGHRSLVYKDTAPSLLIQLFKESGASTVSATQSALDLVAELSSTYPEMHLTILKNRGAFVQRAISGLQQAILLGAGLAFIIILLFLQDFRYSLLLSIVIPVSIMFAFNAMYLHDISLNIMTLGGLALGLGLIIDNGIVVVESIFNEMKQEASLASVAKGVKKVARAITGSTLTTVAIFLPIVYVKGYAAVLFKQQALTISYTLLISLLAAVFLIPAAYHYFILRKRKYQPAIDEKGWTVFQPFYTVFQKGFRITEGFYHKGLSKALAHKKVTLGLLSVLFIIAWGVFMAIPKQYWPDFPSNQVEIKAAVPTSIPFKVVREKTEKTILNLKDMEQVAGLSTRLVDPLDLSSESIQDVMNAPGNYYIYFSLELARAVAPEDFDRQQFLNQVVLPFEHISIFQPALITQGMVGQWQQNLIVYISGESGKTINQTASALSRFLTAKTDVTDVVLDIGGEHAVKSVKIDPQIFMFNNVSPDRFASDLQLKTGETQIGMWQEKLHNLPVIVRWDSAGVKPLEGILTSLHSPGKSLLRTEQLIETEPAVKVEEVKRVNRRQVATVSANIPAFKLSDAAEMIKRWGMENSPPGVTVSIAGESERIAKSYRDLFLAFVMAVILVYLILAAQFESFLHPLNIILTVPMGLAGAVFGLMIFQQSLTVISLIGIVMLIGIGVNDAIIKLDYMNYLTRRKKITLREAILQTSAEKFRPVMMTTITTIVAMLPMALGFGGNVEMNQPLAVTIIGGLAITTMLTLIITPVLYEVGEGLRQRWHSPKRKK